MLIIGLGNPGTKYKNTRHNIGFEALEKIREHYELPSFSLSKKLDAEISEGRIILAKPLTFMNLSGKAVRKILKKYYLSPPDLLVIQDDIDIPLGEIKVSKDRGSAGHKGINSIISEIGTKDFTRIRIGISPDDKKAITVERFVIQKFSEEERVTVERAFKKAIVAVDEIIKKEAEI